jgi:Ni/Fe-hydrogenase 1 B-type cytochrome subunit
MSRFVDFSPAVMRPKYVWELPVRYFHWINAICIVVLAATGFVIANPPAIQSAAEASQSYWFGWVRFIHFTFAYIFLINFLIRIYWGFAGNRYADWRNYIPYSKRHWKDMWEVIKIDVFQIKQAENPRLGHNALASFTYFLVFIAFVLQVFTGFGLYSAASDSWFASLFKWVPAVFGGDILTRDVHHWMMWFFILFALVHMYLVAYHDYIERNGIVSSMIGGWKFINKDKVERELEFEVKKKNKTKAN